MMANVMVEEKTAVVHQRSRGSARLKVKQHNEQTKVAHLYQEGCAKLRLPTARTNALQAVMINSSGGLTGGDALNWAFELENNTALTVTTQACERVYAASSDVARTTIKIDVAKDAKLAWLPQETILFDNGAYARQIEISLEKNSELFMVEPVVFGRKAMNETVQKGTFQDRWRIRQDGEIIHAEDAFFDGNIKRKLDNLAVANTDVAIATILLIAPRAEALVAEARTILSGLGGVSFWNGKLLARVVCKDSYHLREKLIPLISLMNKDAAMPKIWAL